MQIDVLPAITMIAWQSLLEVVAAMSEMLVFAEVIQLEGIAMAVTVHPMEDKVVMTLAFDLLHPRDPTTEATEKATEDLLHPAAGRHLFHPMLAAEIHTIGAQTITVLPLQRQLAAVHLRLQRLTGTVPGRLQREHMGVLQWMILAALQHAVCPLLQQTTVHLFGMTRIILEGAITMVGLLLQEHLLHESLIRLTELLHLNMTLAVAAIAQGLFLRWTAIVLHHGTVMVTQHILDAQG